MMAPAWVLDVLAAVMLMVAAVSAARLAAARPWPGRWASSDTDVAHLLMAIAMAGMLAAGLRTLPAGAWEIVFGALTGWFGYRTLVQARGSGFRALSGRSCAPHWIHSAAMLYMFAALAGPVAGSRPGMSGLARSAMPALRYPALAFAFALILIGYSLWDLDQLSARRSSRARLGLAITGGGLAAGPAAGMAAGPAGVGPAASAGASAAGGSQLVRVRRTPAEAGLAAQDAGGAPGRRWILLTPAVTVACRIAMGVTMAFLLLVSI
jgi:Domain of unknown function (DUF5134)